MQGPVDFATESVFQISAFYTMHESERVYGLLRLDNSNSDALAWISNPRLNVKRPGIRGVGVENLQSYFQRILEDCILDCPKLATDAPPDYDMLRREMQTALEQASEVQGESLWEEDLLREA